MKSGNFFNPTGNAGYPVPSSLLVKPSDIVRKEIKGKRTDTLRQTAIILDRTANKLEQTPGNAMTIEEVLDTLPTSGRPAGLAYNIILEVIDASLARNPNAYDEVRVGHIATIAGDLKAIIKSRRK